MCTMQTYKLFGYKWPGLLLRMAPSNTFKPHGYTTGPVLGEINRNLHDTKLPLMALWPTMYIVSMSPTECIILLFDFKWMV